MNHKETIHNLIKQISFEVFEFIKEEELKYEDRWVPAAYIKNSLALNFVAVPQVNQQYGEKGWFFAIIARLLEDEHLIVYRKYDGRAYYRTI